MATMQELLGGPNITRLIQKTPSGIPLSVPAQFAVPTRRNVGPTIPYWIETGNQTLAQVIHYGSPPLGSARANRAQKYATAFHTSHFHEFSLMDYQGFVAADGSPQRLGAEEELVRQAAHLKARFVNLRYAAIQRALIDGALYFDSAGNMLPPASYASAVYSVDFAIPAGHKNQLDVYGTGAFIDASWATATTNIPAHIVKILDAAMQQSGLPITTAIYGSDILKYLVTNNYVKDLLPGAPMVSAAFANNEIPSGFLGIQNWIKATSGFYVNGAGTIVKIMPADAIVFCPDVSTAWYELVECSYLVPTQLGVVTPDAISQANFATQVYGMGGYATLKSEPLTIRAVAFDTFLPMICNNLATFIADVVP